ncbi:uncharacterized protein ASCRUDRAFT_69441 [Ascoidea rubescens DSM 1968]|uniref:Uncharacterized protein n=1 Tax=Ascoidea rubescens DSM 1968 TaxID=1344418 RepID=A0A1D2VM84_9ASCO|nr:hypothetical protein ASCRUDRAFT_69441 [Ascoidea rubescens DSM 1968]ODV62665.1 hypothetical protein ASCRUDRAFT_69441 [Ascoidea rubescens DSM 1968]
MNSYLVEMVLSGILETLKNPKPDDVYLFNLYLYLLNININSSCQNSRKNEKSSKVIDNGISEYNHDNKTICPKDICLKKEIYFNDLLLKEKIKSENEPFDFTNYDFGPFNEFDDLFIPECFETRNNDNDNDNNLSDNMGDLGNYLNKIFDDNVSKDLDNFNNNFDDFDYFDNNLDNFGKDLGNNVGKNLGNNFGCNKKSNSEKNKKTKQTLKYDTKYNKDFHCRQPIKRRTNELLGKPSKKVSKISKNKQTLKYKQQSKNKQ